MEDETRLLAEIAQLKLELAAKEARLREITAEKRNNSAASNNLLTSDDIVRFSRQIILPQIGVEGTTPAIFVFIFYTYS